MEITKNRRAHPLGLSIGTYIWVFCCNNSYFWQFWSETKIFTEITEIWRFIVRKISLCYFSFNFLSIKVMSNKILMLSSLFSVYLVLFSLFLDDFQINFSSNFWKKISKFLTPSSRFFKYAFWLSRMWIAGRVTFLRGNYHFRYDRVTGTGNRKNKRWSHCATFGVNILS